MFTHDQIWNGIDILAEQNGLTVSALAKKAGMHPTCFNKSKRCYSSGKLRWITMENLNKILTSTNTKFSNFAKIVENNQ